MAEQQLPIPGDCRCNITLSVSLQGCPPWGTPPCLPVPGMCLSSAVEPQTRGLQSQTGGWPDAMVTQRLAGGRTGEKRQGPIPGEGQYTEETPNDFPHLRDPGCSLVQETQGPLGERKKPIFALCSSAPLFPKAV